MRLNVARAAANKPEYYAKKNGTFGHNIHLVVARICYQLDDSDENDESDSGDDDVTDNSITDRELF